MKVNRFLLSVKYFIKLFLMFKEYMQVWVTIRQYMLKMLKPSDG